MLMRPRIRAVFQNDRCEDPRASHRDTGGHGSESVRSAAAYFVDSLRLPRSKRDQPAGQVRYTFGFRRNPMRHGKSRYASSTFTPPPTDWFGLIVRWCRVRLPGGPPDCGAGWGWRTGVSRTNRDSGAFPANVPSPNVPKRFTTEPSSRNERLEKPEAPYHSRSALWMKRAAWPLVWGR